MCYADSPGSESRPIRLGTVQGYRGSRLCTTLRRPVSRLAEGHRLRSGRHARGIIGGVRILPLQ